MTGSVALAAVLFAGSVALGSGLVPIQQATQQKEPAPAAADATPAPAKPETGPELFISSGCSHCHMLDGHGGVKGPNLSGIGRRWKNEAIRTRIENGALEMPPYKDVLSEPQISTLVSYLHTRRAREPKVPPPPAQTPPAPAPAVPAPSASDPS